MRRFPAWLCAAVFAGACLSRLARGQVSDEEQRKRDLFLKSREEMRVTSPIPTETPAPWAKPSPARRPPVRKPTPEPSETPEPTARPTRAPERQPEKTPTPLPSRTPTPSPGRVIAPIERPIAPAPSSVPAPAPSASGTVTNSPSSPYSSPPPGTGTEEPAQLTIEKSGMEKQSGFSLIPFHFFRKHYRYITSSVQRELDRAPVMKRRWQFIIVHNSGTRQGNARAFDYYHRNVRRMPNGLAYHFVIGNGTSSGNGQIEVGDRWRRQINGGHVHSDYLNNIALGICLVGDFNRDQPTRQQLDSCEELIRYLRIRCGKIDRRFIAVKPHREMNPPQWATDCPGDAFPYSWFGRFVE